VESGRACGRRRFDGIAPPFGGAAGLAARKRVEPAPSREYREEMDPSHPRTQGVESAPDDTAALPGAGTDADQIVERLRWTPKQRLAYLLDILDFEARAVRARRLP